MNAMLYLGIAAFVSILVFRILQPYAFLGPGFFGLRPNPQWVANIREQRSQAAGDIDWPPSLQWARRPVWFSAQNMVEWGLGVPLGILAFVGFLWAGWRMLKGDWPRHVVLWLWGGFYFVWQSLHVQPHHALPDAHLPHSGNLCRLGSGGALESAQQKEQQ